MRSALIAVLLLESCSSCAVIEVEATLRVRAGKSTIHGVKTKLIGDTGECGDCMHVD